MHTKKRPPENLRWPPDVYTHTCPLHRVDASRKSGQSTAGRIAVKCALLRTTMQFWHCFLVRGLGGYLITTGDGFLDFTQIAANAATARAIALAASFSLADSFLSGSAVSHFKFRLSNVPSGAVYRAVQPGRQVRTAGIYGESDKMRDHGGPAVTRY
jgi:hypothetical protein